MPFGLFFAGFGLILAESFMLTVLLWNLVSISQGGWLFGITMGLAALLPLPMQKVFDRISAFPSSRPRKNLLQTIFLSAFGVILSILFYHHIDGQFLFPIGLGYFTLAFVLVNQNFETVITQLVLRQRLDSMLASSRLQMITTGASLAGASLAGFCLESAGTTLAFMMVLLLYILAILPLVFFCFPIDLDSIKSPANSCPMNVSTAQTLHSIWKQESFWGILGVSLIIASFNVFLPQYVQMERQWTALSFGILDAAAGFGAFLACFAATSGFGKANLFWIAPMIFFAAGFGFCLGPSQGFAALLVGFWGFAFNGLRTLYRERLFCLASDDESAAKITTQIVLSRTMIETGSPIALSWLMFQYTPSAVIAWAGSLMAVGFLGIHRTFLVNKSGR